MKSMKRAATLGLMFFIAAASAACGDKPAQAPPHDVPPLDSSANTAGTGTASTAATAAPSAEMQKGVAAIKSKDFAEAKTVFLGIVQKEPSNAEAQFYLGVALENTKDKKGALAAYEAAVKNKRDFDDALANLSALYIDEARFDDAVRVLEAAEPEKRKNGGLALNLAVAYAGKDDRAKAKTAFEAAKRLAPRDPMVLLTQGQWLGKWKDPAAPAVLKSAADAAPDDVGVLASAGFELKNVGAFADCTSVLDRAIGLKDVAELRTYRALCKLGLKDKKGALDDLLAATKNEPKYAPAHFYLGGRYADDKAWKKAADAYDMYLKLDADGPLAAPAKARAKLARDKAAGKK